MDFIAIFMYFWLSLLVLSCNAFRLRMKFINIKYSFTMDGVGPPDLKGSLQRMLKPLRVDGIDKIFEKSIWGYYPNIKFVWGWVCFREQIQRSNFHSAGHIFYLGEMYPSILIFFEYYSRFVKPPEIWCWDWWINLKNNVAGGGAYIKYWWVYKLNLNDIKTQN